MSGEPPEVSSRSFSARLLALALEELQGFRALVGDPAAGYEEAPDGGDGEELLEAFGLVVASEGPFAKTALLEKADKLYVSHSVLFLVSSQHRVLPNWGASKA